MRTICCLFAAVLFLSGCGQREMLPPSRANHSPERIKHPEERRIFTEAIAALNVLREKYPYLKEAEPELYVKTLSGLSDKEMSRVEDADEATGDGLLYQY